MVTTELCPMKRRKDSHIHIANGTMVFQSHSWIRLSIHVSGYWSETRLYLECCQEEVKSALIAQLPDNQSMLITEQVFLFAYPDTTAAEPHPETERGLTATIPQQRNAWLKKSWNKRKQLQMAESLYLRHNHKSSFCYILFGTFWFSSWGKKKFLYSNISTEFNIKCVNIYI